MNKDPDFETLQKIQRLYGQDNVRRRKTVALEIQNLSAQQPERFINIAPPGALVVVLSYANSSFLAELRRSLVGDLDNADRLMFAMRTRLARRTRTTFEAAVQEMVELPSLTDIRHGGRTIATNVPVLSEDDATIFTFPYLGGPLAEGGISFVEKYRDSPAIAGTAILRSPMLSSAETAAKQLVGDDERELQIGSPSMCYAASAATMAVTVAAVTVAITGALPDEDSVVVGDAPGLGRSVEELILARRQMLKS